MKKFCLVFAFAIVAMAVDAASPCRGISFRPLPQGAMLYGDPVHLKDGKPFAKDPTVIRLGGRYLMYYSVNDGEQWKRRGHC